MMLTLFAILIAYLFGSISSAIIVCFCLKLPDPRTEGSMNPGASNVLRIGGKFPALITLLGDMLKGFIPVFFFKQLGFNTFDLSLISFAAFIGHLYPLFFQFRGGKGVATSVGCIFALNAWVGLISALTWIIFVICFRYASLASIILGFTAPIYFLFLTHQYNYVAMMVMMSLFLLIRHKENIKKLIHGEETKII